MKEITRRDFIKTAEIFLAGSLFYPVPTLEAKTNNIIDSYKTKDFSIDSDEVLLARMIYGEARSLFDDKIDPDYKEPIMIGFTPINRAKDKVKENGSNLKQAILKSNLIKNKKGKKIRIHQYSCFNSWDPNLKKLKNPERYDPKKWGECLKISKNILEGKLSHLNYGQSHYHSKDMEKFPKWAEDPRMERVWGQEFFKHLFYKYKA